MTVEQAMCRIAEQHPWTATWLRFGAVCVTARGRTWEVASPDVETPRDLEALGCAGWDSRGRLCWVGFDLDLDHGTRPYKSTAEAIDDARRIRDRLDGYLEIRHSKSGQGLHCRHMLPGAPDTGLTKEHAKATVQKITRGAWVRLDASPIGRQVFGVWARNPGPRGFELVEAHRWD